MPLSNLGEEVQRLRADNSLLSNTLTEARQALQEAKGQLQAQQGEQQRPWRPRDRWRRQR